MSGRRVDRAAPVPTAAWFNSVLRAARRALPTASGGLSAVGPKLALARPARPFLAKITGGEGPYEWAEVDGPRTGDDAYEANGAAVDADAEPVVLMTWSGIDHRFSRDCDCEGEVTWIDYEVLVKGCHGAPVPGAVVNAYDDPSLSGESYVGNAASDATGVAVLTIPEGRPIYCTVARYSFNDRTFPLSPEVSLTPAPGFHCMPEYPDCGLPAKDQLKAAVEVPGYGAQEVDIEWTDTVSPPAWIGRTSGTFGGCTDGWEGCGGVTIPGVGSYVPPYDVDVEVRWRGGQVVLIWFMMPDTPGLETMPTPCPAPGGVNWSGTGVTPQPWYTNGGPLTRICSPAVFVSHDYFTPPILWEGDDRLCFNVNGTATVTE